MDSPSLTYITLCYLDVEGKQLVFAIPGPLPNPGIGILQSRDPRINPGIENPVKQPMATDQAEGHQCRSYRLHGPAY